MGMRQRDTLELVNGLRIALAVSPKTQRPANRYQGIGGLF